MKNFIIGFGNTLRRDDGLGVHIVEQLSKLKSFTDTTIFQAVPQLDLNLVEEIVDADRVLFIDARADENSEPLLTEELSLAKIETTNFYPSNRKPLHFLTPLDILELTHQWYDKRVEGWLILPKGYEFDIGQGLSSSAQANADLTVSYIVEHFLSSGT